VARTRAPSRAIGCLRADARSAGRRADKEEWPGTDGEEKMGTRVVFDARAGDAARAGREVGGQMGIVRRGA
jgi:hypothetical protein